MRRLLTAVLFAWLAGCAGPLGPETDPGSETSSAEADAVPDPIRESRNLVLATAPSLVPGGCFQPGIDAACYEFPFHPGVAVEGRATLVWGNSLNDFDLLLYRGDELVSNDGVDPGPGVPANTQVMQLHGDDLVPGDYTFRVVARAAVNDAFTLEADFSAA